MPIRISQETGIYHALLRAWVKKYIEGGEAALENKRKPGNPLAKYLNRKELSPMEQLEYENALLKRELLRKNIEIIKLKKAKEQEGGRCLKSTIREIYAQIEKDSAKHSVQELCNAYEISRSVYYKWLKRKGKLNTDH